MKPLEICTVARAVKAVDYTSTLAHDEITGVQFDSRKVQPGDLFVPLMGERDGHDFIGSAVANGAKAVLFSHEFSEMNTGVAAIQVDDTLQALQDLAHAYIQMLDVKVVGITGSAGKTTTKDMTAAALSGVFNVHKTEGNYNNEIGLPMTILQAPEETEVMVLEMGMSGPNEISELSKIAEPDIAVITMIGESHIEYLGSRDNIAKAKLEIVDGLKPGGALIYPGDEPLLPKYMPERDEPFEQLHIGLDEDEDVYAMNIDNDQFETRFNVNLSPEEILTIPVVGKYNVKNALSACAVAYLLGVSLENVTESLRNFKLTANRMQWVEGIRESEILNDTYNANPSAMRQIIDTFATLPTRAANGRRLLVLGDMLELGEYSESLHREIGDHIDFDRFQGVYVIGHEMRALAEQLLDSQYPTEALRYYESDLDQLIADLQSDIQPYDQVLVKGSHGMNLIAVVEALKIDQSEA